MHQLDGDEGEDPAEYLLVCPFVLGIILLGLCGGVLLWEIAQCLLHFTE